MLELLQYFGLPVGISSVSGRIDEIIVIVHYLMLVLFVGWGIFFIVSNSEHPEIKKQTIKELNHTILQSWKQLLQ